MTRYVDETEPKRYDRAIDVWDNEGGASVRAPSDEQYGRRMLSLNRRNEGRRKEHERLFAGALLLETARADRR